MTLQQLKRLAIHHLQFSEPEKSLQYLLRALQLDRSDEDSFRMTLHFVENWNSIFGPHSPKYDKIKTLLEKVVSAVQENEQTKQTKKKKRKKTASSTKSRPQSTAPAVPNFGSVSSIIALNKDAMRGGWDSVPGSIAAEIAAQKTQNMKRKKVAHQTKPSNSARQAPNARSSFMDSELLYPSAVLSLGIPATDAMALENARQPVAVNNVERKRPQSASIAMGSPYAVLTRVREGNPRMPQRPQSASRSRRKNNASASRPSSTSHGHHRGSKRPQSASIHHHPGIVQSSVPTNPYIPHIPSQHVITDIVLHKKEHPPNVGMSPAMYRATEHSHKTSSHRGLHPRPKSAAPRKSKKRPQSASTNRSKLQRVSMKQQKSSPGLREQRVEEQRKYIQEQQRLIEALRQQLHTQQFLADPSHEEEEQSAGVGFQSTLRAHVSRNPFAPPDGHGPLLKEAEEIERAKFIQNMEKHIQSHYPMAEDYEGEQSEQVTPTSEDCVSGLRRMSAAILHAASSRDQQGSPGSPLNEKPPRSSSSPRGGASPRNSSTIVRTQTSLHGTRSRMNGSTAESVSTSLTFMERITQIEDESIRHDRLKFLTEFSNPGLRSAEVI